MTISIHPPHDPQITLRLESSYGSCTYPSTDHCRSAFFFPPLSSCGFFLFPFCSMSAFLSCLPSSQLQNHLPSMLAPPNHVSIIFSPPNLSGIHRLCILRCESHCGQILHRTSPVSHLKVPLLTRSGNPPTRPPIDSLPSSNALPVSFRIQL